MILMRMRVDFLKQSTGAVRGIKGAREGKQGKPRQGKGVETFPADAQWSSEEFSHRKTFRAGAQPQKNIQGTRPLKEGLG